MSYKVNVPPHVEQEIRDALAALDGGDLRPHLAFLPRQLEDLGQDPRSGYEIRKDFVNGWFIEVGDYRLYYRIDEARKEVRCFLFERFYYGW